MKFRIYYCSFEISFYLNILIAFRLRFLTMIRLVLCLTLICSFFGFSQTQTFDINWKGATVMSTSKKAIEIPYFNIENHNFSFENGLVFSKQWPINGSINQASA